MAGDTFDAGTVYAEARLDRDQYARDVAAFKRDLVRLEREARVKIAPTFDDKEIKAGQAQTRLLRQQLEQLGKVRSTPRLELDGGAAARTQIAEIEQSLRGLNGRTASPSVRVRGGAQASKEMQGLAGATNIALALFGKAILAVGALQVGAVAAAAALQIAGTAAGGMAVLPAVLGAGIGLLAVMKIGVAGVGDALKAAAEGDVKALDEALKKLAPSARAFVVEVQKAGPAWRAMRLDVQQQLFAQLAGSVNALSTAYLPVMQARLTGLAREMGLLGAETVSFATNSRQVDSVNQILGNTEIAVSAVRSSFGFLLQALLDVAAVGSQLLPDLAGGFAGWAESVASTVRAMRDSGQLLAIMERGLETIYALAGAIVSIYGIIRGVVRAAGMDGQGLAEGLATILYNWEAWVNSAAGQQALIQFFTIARQLVEALAPILGIAAVALGQFIQTIGPALPPLAQGVGAVLQAAGPLLGIFSQLTAAILPAVGAILQFAAPFLGPLLGAILAVVGAVRIYQGTVKTIAAVTKAWGIAQAILNGAMLLNPIGLIVAGLALFVAGLILAWQNSETFRNIVMGAWAGIQQAAAAAWGFLQGVFAALGTAWTAIGAAATWVWQSVLVPAWAGIVAGAQAVGAAFTWLWSTVIQPVFDFIATAAKILLAVLVTIVLAPLILAVKGAGIVFTWLWESVIQPVWTAISGFIVSVWEGTILPVLTAIGTFITTNVGAAWLWLQNLVTTVWTAITTAISTAWNWLLTTILQPIIDFVVGQLTQSWQGWQLIITAVWEAVRAAIDVAWAFIRDSVFQPIVDFLSATLGPAFQVLRDVAAAAWQGLQDALAAVWGWITANIFDPMVTFVTVTIPDAFNRAVDGIKGAWDKIQSIVEPPIRFMVDTVYNQGILPAWNWIAGLVGLGKLEPVHFATGGMVPGTGNGDTVPAMLTPGEFVLSKPAVAAAGGLAAVDAMHQMLRAGYATGGPVARFQQGGPVAPNPAPNQGSLDSLWSVVTGGLSKMNAMFTGTLWGKAAIGLVKTATDRLWPFMMEKIASFFASLIGIGGGVGGGALVGGGDARAWIIAHESGGNPTARNPSSTASGLYQMINGTWKAYGGSTPTAAQASVAEQNAVADRYVAARYGSWENAQAFWQTHHYYDAGGMLPPGISTVVNNTGRPEPVLTPEQWRAITAPPAPGAVAGTRPGETIDVGQLNATMTEVRDLLERRGTGATVNVNQQSDPVATARAAVLQLRLS